MPFQIALQTLLDELDKIEENHGEIHDTAVREVFSGFIFKSFVEGNLQYPLPESFQMFSEEANQLIRQALRRFLDHPDVINAHEQVDDMKDRLIMFQDEAVVSFNGSQYFDYFGHIDIM